MQVTGPVAAYRFSCRCARLLLSLRTASPVAAHRFFYRCAPLLLSLCTASPVAGHRFSCRWAPLLLPRRFASSVAARRSLRTDSVVAIIRFACRCAPFFYREHRLRYRYVSCLVNPRSGSGSGSMGRIGQDASMARTTGWRLIGLVRKAAVLCELGSQ